MQTLNKIALTAAFQWQTAKLFDFKLIMAGNKITVNV